MNRAVFIQAVGAHRRQFTHLNVTDVRSLINNSDNDLSGDKNKFKLALKRYLLHNSFYSLEEYFNT